MFQEFLTLHKYNTKLAKRVRGIPYFYALAVLLVAVLVSYISYSSLMKANGINEYDLCLTVFIAIMFDVVFIILRMRSGSLINYSNLDLFPMPKINKILCIYSLVFFDIKNLVYVSAMIVFAFMAYVNLGLYMSILSLVVWATLAANISLWLALLYLISYKYLDKLKNKMQVIGLIFMAAMLGLDIWGSNLVKRIPVIANAGKSLYGIWTANMGMLHFNMAVLAGSAVVPLGIFYVLKMRRY